jgi:hypothetical protein
MDSYPYDSDCQQQRKVSGLERSSIFGGKIFQDIAEYKESRAYSTFPARCKN